MAPIKQRDSSPVAAITSTPQKSPIKKTRKMAISITQKQALIDNLQLEITERARRLRAQYNIQAQQLRSRVEMRINRIPSTLRKMKMGELLAKSLASSQQQQEPPKHPPKSPYVARPPPVPAKDGVAPQPIARKPVPVATNNKATRGQKRTSEEISSSSNTAHDKENHGAVENPKKRIRGAPAVEPPHVQHGQILSPTSSNARIIPARERERPGSPAKSSAPPTSTFSRPASPIKTSTTTKGVARAGAGAGLTRKVTTASSASSSAGSTTATGTTRTRKAGGATAPSSSKAAAAAPSNSKPAASRPATATATRGKRKVSESSETSTGTVVKKKGTAAAAGSGGGAASRAPASAKTSAPATTAKRTVMGTIKSATTAAAKKAPAAAAKANSHNASTSSSTGRTLRKRG